MKLEGPNTYDTIKCWLQVIKVGVQNSSVD